MGGIDHDSLATFIYKPIYYYYQILVVFIIPPQMTIHGKKLEFSQMLSESKPHILHNFRCDLWQKTRQH